MKAKTIKAILSKKFKNFLDSIEDESVRKLVEEGTIITGGSIVSLLTKENVNDFDLYFRNSDTAYAVAKYYVGEIKKNPPPCFKGDEKHTIDIRVDRNNETDRVKIIVKSAGIVGEKRQDDYQYFEGVPDQSAAENYVNGTLGNIQDLDDEPADALDNQTEGKKYRPLFLSSNAITLSNKVQLIIRFFGEPEEIHSNYDFVHCTSYWTSWDNQLVLRPEALESIITKELRYVGSKYPICSMIRTRKFISRGWTINAGQFVKMAWQISKLDLSDIAVLEDQLVGVDAAYFGQLISALQKKNEDTSKPIDGQYLMTIIDKIF